jgi:hypothetical protein
MTVSHASSSVESFHGAMASMTGCVITYGSSETRMTCLPNASAHAASMMVP